jgi:hypothetical protein
VAVGDGRCAAKRTSTLGRKIGLVIDADQFLSPQANLQPAYPLSAFGDKASDTTDFHRIPIRRVFQSSGFQEIIQFRGSVNLS